MDIYTNPKFMRDEKFQRATPLNALVGLLRQWQGGAELLNEADVRRLTRLAHLELGMLQQPDPIHAKNISELAERMESYLPTAGNQTMSEIYDQVRQRASKALRVSIESITWDCSWADLDPLFVDLFLMDLLEDCKCAWDSPNDLVGETVRSIWKARGGVPFWESVPYENNWCPSQGIFYDLRSMPDFSRIIPQCADMEENSTFIQPSTAIDTVIPKNKHAALLQSIETRFGVWLGRRPKGDILLLLVAGILASPLGFLIPICVMLSIFGKISGGIMVVWTVWVCCWCIAIMLWAKSQPRLLPEVKTVKDLVKAIASRRRIHAIVRPRIRPISTGEAF